MKGAQKQGEGRGAGSRRSSKSRVATRGLANRIKSNRRVVHVVYLFSFRTWSDEEHVTIFIGSESYKQSKARHS